MPQPPSQVFKILTAIQFAELTSAGCFDGGADDQRDGFIHLSCREQVRRTIQKHFAGLSDLVILEFSAEELGAALVMEEARNGSLFPHLYGTLRRDSVRRRFSPEQFYSQLDPDGI